MSGAIENQADFFFGVMVLKDEKWSPHSKFEGGAFGTALLSAEELDNIPKFDGGKIMKIPVKSMPGVEPKEMWISPRFEARQRAASSAKVSAGLKSTQQKMDAARRSQFKK